MANVTNTIGLVPGSLSGAIGYRRELRGQGQRARHLGLAAVAGGATGAVLLLVLPSGVFRHIVPVLILVACLLVAIQPWLSKHVAERQQRLRKHGGVGLFVTVYATAVYGGYFGAAQSVILIALLAIFLSEDLQRLNALKNVLALLVNGVAALIFVIFSHVVWGVAGLLAMGAVVGGQVGATVGRRLSPTLLRGIILVVGVTVAITLLV